jgi:hypothetical protein
MIVHFQPETQTYPDSSSELMSTTSISLSGEAFDLKV